MIKLYGGFTIAELKEILALAENQETNEKYTDTVLNINGNHAKIHAKIDEDGDIEIHSFRVKGMAKLFGSFNTNELKEILLLAENQETTDRYTNTELHINGDNAEIDAKIEKDGAIEVLSFRVDDF